ncbi:hypothetical protein HA050_06720 [Iodobacter sp. HSC-16F04]|uniref:DUF6249 domain-containing protein n=1 Tax=Iodobacter violaceini TaxID=3044271 RepID=A0ABX0KN20_9NEIS|nr:DUF6249 domain-containing protein [Iodobacter violacea]NHQ85811.1 hypothetical protein [Iodobacter violacea]
MNALQALLSAEIIIPVVSVLMPVFIVAIVFYFRHQKLQLQHETIQKMLAKDLPIPPELFNTPSKAGAENLFSAKADKGAKDHPGRRLHEACTLIGIGAGLMVFFHFSGFSPVLCWAGAIPLALGMARLLAVLLEPLVSKKVSIDD